MERDLTLTEHPINTLKDSKLKKCLVSTDYLITIVILATQICYGPRRQSIMHWHRHRMMSCYRMHRQVSSFLQTIFTSCPGARLIDKSNLSLLSILLCPD